MLHYPQVFLLFFFGLGLGIITAKIAIIPNSTQSALMKRGIGPSGIFINLIKNPGLIPKANEANPQIRINKPFIPLLLPPKHFFS